MGFTKLTDHSTINTLFCNLLGGCPGKIMKMSECFEKHNAHQTADHIQGSKLKTNVGWLSKKGIDPQDGYQNGSLGLITMVLKKQKNLYSDI